MLLQEKREEKREEKSVAWNSWEVVKTNYSRTYNEEPEDCFETEVEIDHESFSAFEKEFQ